MDRPIVEPYPTVAPFEHHDSERTHRFPTEPIGDGPHHFELRTAPTVLPGAQAVVTREPGELFVLFGAFPDTGPGARVARLDAATLEVRWTSPPLDALPGGSRWRVPGALGVLPDGDLVVVTSDVAVRLSPRTGEPLAIAVLPSPGTPADSSHNGLTVLSDGMLATKSVHRTQPDVEGREGIWSGTGPMGTGSQVTVLDPATWSVRTSVRATEHLTGRITSARLGADDVLYLAGRDSLHRWRWDGAGLTIDSGWPVRVRHGEQTAPSANGVMGGLTLVATNLFATSAPQALHCIDQWNPTRHTTVEPFADEDAAESAMPAMPALDPDNRMVFPHDGLCGRIAGWDVGEDGTLTERWRARQRSLNFTVLVGPPDRRLLVGADVFAGENVLDADAMHLVARDALTGEVLTRGGPMPALCLATGVTPGFDHRFYVLGADGTLTEAHLVPRA